MEQSGLSLVPAMDRQAESWEEKGKTISFFGWERSVRGFLVFGDPVRPGAEEVVRLLHARGVEVWLVSGDAACHHGESGASHWESVILGGRRSRRKRRSLSGASRMKDIAWAWSETASTTRAPLHRLMWDAPSVPPCRPSAAPPTSPSSRRTLENLLMLLSCPASPRGGSGRTSSLPSSIMLCHPCRGRGSAQPARRGMRHVRKQPHGNGKRAEDIAGSATQGPNSPIKRPFQPYLASGLFSMFFSQTPSFFGIFTDVFFYPLSHGSAPTASSSPFHIPFSRKPFHKGGLRLCTKVDGFRGGCKENVEL